MSKDSSRMVKNRFNFSTTQPQQFSQEVLQGMNDDRLEALRSMLKGKIFSLIKSPGNSAKTEKEMTDFQTEHSYVSRELEVRHTRKKVHEEYLQKTRRNKSFGRGDNQRRYDNKRQDRR